MIIVRLPSLWMNLKLVTLRTKATWLRMVKIISSLVWSAGNYFSNILTLRYNTARWLDIQYEGLSRRCLEINFFFLPLSTQVSITYCFRTCLMCSTATTRMKFIKTWISHCHIISLTHHTTRECYSVMLTVFSFLKYELVHLDMCTSVSVCFPWTDSISSL